MKVVVTGSSGKAGRAVVRALAERDHDVLGVDLVPPRERLARFLIADLTELGQTVECLVGADAVVHLAAIPASGIQTEEATFRTNLGSTYNVFEAARIVRPERVVWASSETIFGIPIDHGEPAYAPIDDEHPPLPQSSYALSKLLGEEAARHVNRWTGIPFVALRFSNIMEPDDYAAFPGWWDDPQIRRWNLWSYVDAQDVGQSCVCALEAEISGAEHFIVAAADSVMTRPTRELMAEVYPDVPYRPTGGDHDSLLSSDKARRLLGYEPKHSWREHVAT